MGEPRRLPPTGDVPGLGLVPLLIEVWQFPTYFRRTGWYIPSAALELGRPTT